MLLMAFALSASLPFYCPPQIESRQQLLTTPAGWQEVSRDARGRPNGPLAHRLDNLSLFDGDPAEQAQLKPDNGDSSETHYWSLDKGNGRPFYLVCHYQDSAITLQQALPKGISHCRVNENSPHEPIGLICRK